MERRHIIAVGVVVLALLAGYQVARSTPISIGQVPFDEMADTPVNVAGTSDDAQLDDHVWMRLSGRVHGDASIAALPDDLRAYYATRAFEWEWGSGGITGFLLFEAEVGPYVADGYRRLGLAKEARMFEEMWSSPALQTMLAGFNANPDYEPSAAAVDALDAIAAAIGQHDADRIEFVRQRPEAFSV